MQVNSEQISEYTVQFWHHNESFVDPSHTNETILT